MTDPANQTPEQLARAYIKAEALNPTAQFSHGARIMEGLLEAADRLRTEQDEAEARAWPEPSAALVARAEAAEADNTRLREALPDADTLRAIENIRSYVLTHAEYSPGDGIVEAWLARAALASQDTAEETIGTRDDLADWAPPPAEGNGK